MGNICKFSLIALTGVLLAFDYVSVNGQTQCGKENCYLGKKDAINIHVIAHTHDDTGWKKTVDQYYFGSRPDIVLSGVQYILDTTIEQIWKDPNKRFTWAEVAFLYRWWNEIEDDVKDQVKTLVNEGRLQFALGGWCVNDEGSVHYNALIDQHALGMQFLQEHFGECGRPTVGWQIDTFGHTKEQANLFGLHGMDGMFFSRLDSEDFEKRKLEKRMEFIWHGSSNQDDSGTMFTHILRDGYGPPYSMFPYIFEPVMDNPALPDYNWDTWKALLKNAVTEYRENYNSNHMIFMSGEDFEYENARKNFKNTDKSIKNMKGEELEGMEINMFYSTPACYLAAIHAEGLTYTKEEEDFMPMRTGPNAFWNGYFTSRPGLKGYGRVSNNLLQVCKQLDVIGQLQPDYPSQPKIDTLRQAVAVLQHHDAITGTEWQPVSDDYTQRMYKGSLQCEEVIDASYGKLLPKDQATVVTQKLCPYVNISYCPATEATPNKFSATIYNPLGHSIQHSVRIPVVGAKFQVLNSAGQVVQSALLTISDETKNVPERGLYSPVATNELVFRADLPALGFHTFLINNAGSNDPSQPQVSTTISNEHLRLSFSGNGLVEQIENLDAGVSAPLAQNFHYYFPHTSGGTTSSAYYFRPNSTIAYPTASTVTATVYKTSVVEEVRQVFTPWSSQVIRLYPGDTCAEFEWTIGPIPFGNNVGREIITRYETDFATQGKFWTDSNGRQMIERRRDYRPMWDFTNTEPIAGNYFPVGNKILIKDDTKNLQLTVITDRAHGGSSIQDGNVEIMLHRRLGGEMNELGADGQGLVVRGKNWVCFEKVADAGIVHREMGQRAFMSPILSIGGSQDDYNSYSSKYNMNWSGLERELPANVHLLTMMQWGKQGVLVRLEHFYAASDDATLSQDVTLSLKDLFKTVPIVSIEEMNLGGDRPLSDARRLSWKMQGGGQTNGDMSSFVEPITSPDYNVKLSAMQIRTFLLRTSASPPSTTPATGGGAKAVAGPWLHAALVILCLLTTLHRQ